MKNSPSRQFRNSMYFMGGFAFSVVMVLMFGV